MSIVRGRVLGEDGQGLAGVRVSILDHPELGWTLTSAGADAAKVGWFDLAVNGGGELVVDYAAAGRIPAQRKVRAEWHDYAVAPDVVLRAYAPAAAPVAMNQGVYAAAQGPVSTDTDGSRRPTVLFPPGTTARVRNADGSLGATLPTLTLRATEMTVGDAGLRAMPADLPPSSAYTYAADFDAVEAGGAGVAFSQPVPVYVDNFVGFPVGTFVPAGFYDRAKGTWVAEASGRVIRIVSCAARTVDTGDSPIAIPPDEVAKICALGYGDGATLWRVPVGHFSAYDFNWGIVPPADAVGPTAGPPQPEALTDCTNVVSGSIIECDNQVLGEELPLVGTPFFLRYSSDRNSARASARTLDIPLSGASTLPDSLSRIRAIIAVAGRAFELGSSSRAPYQSIRWTWDGLDAYGRKVQGRQTARVLIGYVYKGAKYVSTERFGGIGLAPDGSPRNDRSDSSLFLST